MAQPVLKMYAQLFQLTKIVPKNDTKSLKSNDNILSCVVDVDGFGVDGAEGVDVPDVDAVAEVLGV